MAKPKKELVIADSPELAAARSALGKFLKANRSARLVELGGKTPLRILFEPWGDRSVAFYIAGDVTAELKACFDNIILPDRLSAIYHKDARALEIIFTAYKIPEQDEAIKTRKFKFTLSGKSYVCEFRRSSDRLLMLADITVYPSLSDTSFRNLQSFTSLVREEGKDDPEARERFGEPLSFWIENIDWNEEETLEVLRHLNFYLRYYDSSSPYISIHPPADQTNINPRSRYIEGRFPDEINSRVLNPTLLSFWTASFDEEIANKFLFHFRIIEFVTSYYLQQEQRAAVRKILSSPSLTSDPQGAMDMLVGVIREERPQETIRFTRAVTELVHEDKIWNEICLNPEFFTKAITFDGGFSLSALVANTKSKDCFGPKGMENFARNLRAIRNALAHGGEAQAGRIILPTSRNFKKLQPWVHLIGTAAGEVVLYEHLT